MGIKMLYRNYLTLKGAEMVEEQKTIHTENNKVADRNPTFPVITLNVSNQKAEIAEMNSKTNLTIFSL